MAGLAITHGFEVVTAVDSWTELIGMTASNKHTTAMRFICLFAESCYCNACSIVAVPIKDERCLLHGWLSRLHAAARVDAGGSLLWGEACCIDRPHAIVCARKSVIDFSQPGLPAVGVLSLTFWPYGFPPGG